jgi:hypothetical protein
MLTLWGRKQRFCDNLHRREFLRLGALGLGGLTLADLLRLEARGEVKEQGRAKSIIYVVLSGGPSHIDMYDLKPDSPAEYRGPFKPIATSLSGVRICELMPLQAAMMDRLALLRGIRSVENDHFLSEVYTGLPRTAGHRPSFGSVVSRLVEQRSQLPAYVSLDRPATGPFDFEKPYYAGAGHAPFRPFGDALADLNPAKSLDRLQDRKQLLTAFDTMRRDLDQGDALSGLDVFQTRALDIITSPKVRDAFDLSKEPDKLLQSYGTGKYPHQTVKTIFYPWEGKRFLQARRLVEAGVRVVTLRLNEWDHHGGPGFPQADIFGALRCLMPLLDRSLSALFNDLRDRGLDKEVLVVVLGEFGRTPKIEPQHPGRGHWAEAGCAVIYGGGLRMGQVIGETDARAERAKTGNITFQNIFATIYHYLGIDPATTLTDFNGRPQYLLDNREAIAALI